MKKSIRLLSVTCLLLFAASMSQAADADLANATGTALSLLDKVKASSANWSTVLQGYATNIFWSLALIQLIWTMFPLVFKQADFGEIIGELIRYILTIGFFATLLLFYTDWSQLVIDSFKQASAAASGLPDTIKPGDIFGRGVEFGQAIWGETSFWTPINNVGLSLAGLVILISFTFIAAFMFVTIVEAYFIVNAAVLFMGFGASQWTREYTLNAVKYCVSVGAKMFTLILIVGLINELSVEWLILYKANPDEASVLTMIGISVICAYFTKTLPELIQGMISGTSTGGGSAIGGMATAAAAGATAGAAAAAGVLQGAGSTAAIANTGGDSLSKSLDSSLANGANVSNSTGSARGVSEGLGGNVGGSSSNESASSSPRTSGAGGDASSKSSNAANGLGSSMSSTGTSQGAAEAPKASSSVLEAAKQADNGKKLNSGGAIGSIADTAVRTSGILAAMTVPGMENAAGLSVDSAPKGAESSESNDQNSPDFAENSSGVENTIRPSDAPVETQTGESANTSRPTDPSNPKEGEQ